MKLHFVQLRLAIITEHHLVHFFELLIFEISETVPLSAAERGVQRVRQHGLDFDRQVFLDIVLSREQLGIEVSDAVLYLLEPGREFLNFYAELSLIDLKMRDFVEFVLGAHHLRMQAFELLSDSA